MIGLYVIKEAIEILSEARSEAGNGKSGPEGGR
jgi:hypothetical protein